MKIKELFEKHIYNDIFEGKQLGTLYHFTTPDGLVGILNSKRIEGYHGYISTSRNFKLPSENLIGHNPIDLPDIKNNPFHHSVGLTIRLCLDGDAISDKHKVNPILGSSVSEPDNINMVSRHSQEREEMISSKSLPISYVKRVDFLLTNKNMVAFYETISPQIKALGITVFAYKAWRPFIESCGEINGAIDNFRIIL